MQLSDLTPIGLLFDIAGILILWFYGLPDAIGKDYLESEQSIESPNWVRTGGMLLVLLGFLFQLIPEINWNLIIDLIK